MKRRHRMGTDIKPKDIVSLVLFAVMGCSKTEPETTTVPVSDKQIEHVPGTTTASTQTPPREQPTDRPEPPEGMVFLPGGSFEMRHDLHTIDDIFYDIYEVTVARYRACAEAGVCAPAHTTQFQRDACSNTEDEAPVTCVDYFQAEAFCAWQGKRLPSMWEWAWAARGRDEGRKFPWGDQLPDCSLAILRAPDDGCGRGGQWPVGSRPNGVSRDGIHDLIGNVDEWTTTRFNDAENGRLAVGGSAGRKPLPDMDYAFAVVREAIGHRSGFRCVMDTNADMGQGAQ